MWYRYRTPPTTKDAPGALESQRESPSITFQLIVLLSHPCSKIKMPASPLGSPHPRYKRNASVPES